MLSSPLGASLRFSFGALLGPTSLVALAAVAQFCLTACSTEGEHGSGRTKSESRQLESFDGFELGGALDAEVTVGPSQTVELSGDDNIVPLVTTEVKGGRLHIETTKNVRPKVPLVVRITVPKLTSLSVSGAGRVNVRGVQEDRFKVNLSGAAKVVASGVARHVEFDVSGAGSVDAKELKAERADVDVSGAAKLNLFASQSLDVQISGAGKVSYYGNPPEVRSEISGAGGLEKR